MRPNREYTRNIVKGVTEFENPFKTTLELLTRVNYQFGLRFQLAGDMTTCEEGGVSKKLGSQLTKENCLQRCLEAGDSVCNNVEYGNVNSNFQCIMWSGECKTERLGNSIIYRRSAGNSIIIIAIVVIILLILCIGVCAWQQKKKRGSSSIVDH